MNKWYNSQFFVNIASGILIFLFLTGVGGCFNLIKYPLPNPIITIHQESDDPSSYR